MPPAPIGDAAAESALSLDRLDSLLQHWRDGFDWARVERELSNIPQYIAEIDGQRVHFARLQAADSAALRVPLVMFHGWPYSFIEMLPLARELAEHPVDLGDGRSLAFDIVIPSLPGYGPSAPLAGKPFTGPVVAEIMHRLMTDTLGYRRYLTYGEDVGSTTSDWLAALYPDSVIGLFATHAAFPPSSRAERLSEEETAWLQRHDAEWTRGLAYARVQATRPEILAAALNDSPIGLAAWITEKLLAWAGDGTWWTEDELLTTISLYWYTQSIGTSFLPFRDHPQQEELPRIHVPVGVAVQTGERGLPRSYAERTYTDIRQWTDLDRGAHFTAWQAPGSVAVQIRSFVAPLLDP